MSPLALLLSLAVQTASAPTSVALLPATAQGGAATASVDAQLRRTLETLEGFTLLGSDRTLDEVQGARDLGLDCSAGDDGCYGKLAAALRVDVLVVPALAGDTLTLLAYDATTGGRLNVVEDKLPAEGPARLSRLRALLELLLAPERQLGRIVVRAPPDARVDLDGTRTAKGPVARFDAVRAGPHDVLVTLGEQTQRRKLAVVAGEEAIVDVRFEEPPAPAEPPPAAPAELPPLLLAGAGVGAVGALAAVVGGAGAAWATVTLEDARNPLRGDERTTTLRVGQGALAVAAVGVVAAIAGGALAAWALTSE